MRRKLEIAILSLCVLLLSGCSTVQKLKSIKVTSATVESINPMGLRGLDADLLIGLDNPATQFTLEDISGTLYNKGAEFIYFTADPVTVKARATSVYEVHASAILAPGVNLLQVLSLARNYNPEDIEIDVDFTIKLRSGVGKVISLKKLNLKEMMD